MSNLSKEQVGDLVCRTRQLCRLTQAAFAGEMRMSPRTVRRVEGHQAFMTPDQLARLAHLAAAHDEELSAEFVRRAKEIVETTGAPLTLAFPEPWASSTEALTRLEGQAPAPVAAPIEAKPVDLRHLVDAVVCAGADEGDVLPKSVRAILLAAFARAEELGLEVSEVRRALEAGRIRRKPAKRLRTTLES